MDEPEDQDISAESQAIMDYRDACACRFLAMATREQIEAVAVLMKDKILAWIDSRRATAH